MRDRIIGICSSIICVFLFLTLKDEALQTMLFPLILLIALFVISLFLIIRKGNKAYDFGNIRTILTSGILFGLYIIIMPYAGFLVSTTCFLGIFLFISKFKIGKIGLVLTSLGITLSIWFVFSILFKIQLPEILF